VKRKGKEGRTTPLSQIPGYATVPTTTTTGVTGHCFPSRLCPFVRWSVYKC